LRSELLEVFGHRVDHVPLAGNRRVQDSGRQHAVGGQGGDVRESLLLVVPVQEHPGFRVPEGVQDSLLAVGRLASPIVGLLCELGGLGPRAAFGQRPGHGLEVLLGPIQPGVQVHGVPRARVALEAGGVLDPAGLEQGGLMRVVDVGVAGQSRGGQVEVAVAPGVAVISRHHAVGAREKLRVRVLLCGVQEQRREPGRR